MAAVPTIQRGTKTFAASTASMTIVRGVDAGFDTTVDTAKTILLVTANSNDSAFVYATMRFVLTDGDTITITRAAAATETVNVRWTLLTFATGVVVQHKSVSLAIGDTTGTVAIDAASISGGRWIIPSGVTCNQSQIERVASRWTFDSTTLIRATRGESGTASTVACQVVEYDDATVQTVDWTLTATTATTSDQTISAVTLNKTAVFGSLSSATSAIALQGASWNAALTSTTNLRVSRATGTSADYAFTVFVVSFSDQTLVQQLTSTHSSNATKNNTITSVDTTRAEMVLCGMVMPYFGYVASGNASSFAATAELTSATNARTVIGAAVSPSIAAQVVEFNGESVGPTITVQPSAATARVNGDTTNTATFSVTATGTGTVDITAEIESGVGSGTFGTLANGSGATWTGLTGTGSGSASVTLVGTFTAKTLSGRKVRLKADDDNGTTYSNEVVLTVLDGPVLSASTATTNGSGVASVTMTSDDALSANGEILLVTATVRGQVVARTTVRPA